MDNKNTMSCPLCNHNFMDVTDESVITCSDCGVHYHKTCWEMNGGCSTPDCAQNSTNKHDFKSQMKSCQNCGCEIESSVAFCPKCGASVNAIVPMPHKCYCTNCKAEILQNQQYCPKCGQKIDHQQEYVVTDVKKKRRKIIIILVLIVVLFALLAVGCIFAYNTFFPSDIKLISHSIVLEDDTYYQLSYNIAPDTALDKSVEWTSTDTRVAKVDDNGKVTAIDEGIATIIIKTSNGKTDECKVTVTAKDFSDVYAKIGGDDFYCTLGLDGSYMEIDTNPFDIDDYSASSALLMIEKANTELGLPASIWKKMLNTNSLDGRQSESYGNIKVSWKYHPDNGMEVIYEYID